MCRHAVAGQDVTAMKASDFESRLTRSIGADRLSAPRLCPETVARLKADLQVTDRSIRFCAETLTLGKNPSMGAEWNLERYIEELLPLLGDRRQLAAVLLNRGGDAYRAAGEFSKAAEYYRRAVTMSDSNSLEFDLIREKTFVNLGQSLLSLNEKKEAEPYFLRAMAYPWYSLVDQSAEQQEFRDQYVAAGLGLIECRRGNLSALQEVYFVPATEQQLGTRLSAAIQEARNGRK
jgi:tetratricopeptide (TPR) repeat protein